MPGELHLRSGRLAFDSLPAWERAVWKRQGQAMPEYCTIPDRTWSDAGGEGPWARYVDLPNGRRPQHGPADEGWSMAFLVTRYSRDNNRYWLGHYLKRMTACLRRGQVESAAKFAGVLGHYIQDSSVPGHNTDNFLLIELMPFPPGRYWHVHKIFDDDRLPDALLKGARPRLLGRTVPEASFRLEAAYEAMLRFSRTQAIPILQETYADRREDARRRLAQCMNQATELVASAWHTAFCIANSRFVRREAKGLDRLELSACFPELYASQYPYMSFGAGVASPEEGRSEPVRLRGVDVEGQGVAVSGTSAVVYRVPRGLYRRFTAVVGALPGVKPPGPVRFRLAVERTPADRIAVDLNIQTVTTPGRQAAMLRDWTDRHYIIFDSGPIEPSGRARLLDIRIPRCERLILLTSAVGKELVQAAWGRPRLHVK